MGNRKDHIRVRKQRQRKTKSDIIRRTAPYNIEREDTEICLMGNITNSNLKQSHQNKAYRNVITDCQEVYCNKVEI